MLTNNLFSIRKTTSLAICGLTLLSLTGCGKKTDLSSAYDSTKEPFLKWYEENFDNTENVYVEYVKAEDMLSNITKSADKKTVVLGSSSDANVVHLISEWLFEKNSLELNELKTLLKILTEYKSIRNEISQLDKALGVSKEIEEEILSDFILTDKCVILQTEEKSTEYRNEEEDFKVKITWNQSLEPYNVEVKYEIID